MNNTRKSVTPVGRDGARRLTVLTLVLIFPVLSGCGSPGPAPDRSAALPERYRQAERRLEEAKGPGRDRKLCRAFAAVLRDLAARGDPVVHVAVTEVPDRRDPPEAAANLARWKEDAEFWRYGPDVLPQDAIFGKARRQRRAEAVLVHVRAVLKQVTDEELLKLTPLRPGEARAGKVVLEVRTTYRRGKEYHKVRLVNAAYLVRDFAIDWDLRVRDRAGRRLARLTATTSSAGLWAPVPKGEWQFMDEKGKLRHLGKIAAQAQLGSAYRSFAEVFEKKLGIKARR
jgi:hypothetical protein